MPQFDGSGCRDGSGTTVEGRTRILAWRREEGIVPAPTVPIHGSDAARKVRQLRAALRRERMRGRAGHWSYDLARHLSLSRQLRRAEADVET